MKKFIVNAKKKEKKRQDTNTNKHRQLSEFIPQEQKEREKRESIEEQIFQHLKEK